MKERKWQAEFGRWAKANIPASAAFELKVATVSLPFSDVQPHQVAALWHVKHRKLYFKIPDAGYQNPFDSFILASMPAYVVVRYPSRAFYLIDIDDFIHERDILSARKSLTEDRAKEIAAICG